jgi:hypothetical protein
MTSYTVPEMPRHALSKAHRIIVGDRPGHQYGARTGGTVETKNSHLMSKATEMSQTARGSRGDKENSAEGG